MHILPALETGVMTVCTFPLRQVSPTRIWGGGSGGGVGMCDEAAARLCRLDTTSAMALLLYLWRFQTVLGALERQPGKEVSASSRFIYGRD